VTSPDLGQRKGAGREMEGKRNGEGERWGMGRERKGNENGNSL